MMRIFFEEAHFAGDRREAGVSAASEVMEISRKEKGCRFARLLRDANDPDVFYFMELWETEDDWDAHLSAIRGSAGPQAIHAATDRPFVPLLFEGTDVPFR